MGIPASLGDKDVLEVLETAFGKGSVAYRGYIKATGTKVFSIITEKFPAVVYSFKPNTRGSPSFGQVEVSLQAIGCRGCSLEGHNESCCPFKEPPTISVDSYRWILKTDSKADRDRLSSELIQILVPATRLKTKKRAMRGHLHLKMRPLWRPSRIRIPLLTRLA